MENRALKEKFVCQAARFLSPRYVRPAGDSDAMLDAGAVDVILLLGSNDPAPAHMAAELYHRIVRNNPAVKIIASGNGLDGNGHATVPMPLFRKAEAEAYRDRLVECSVPLSSIFTEIESRHTGENLLFSAQIITQNRLAHERLLICQTPALQYRACLFFEKSWPLPWQQYLSFPPSPSVPEQLNDTQFNFYFLCFARELATLVTYMHQPEPYLARADIPDDLLDQFLNLFQKKPTAGQSRIEQVKALTTLVRSLFAAEAESGSFLFER